MANEVRLSDDNDAWPWGLAAAAVLIGIVVPWACGTLWLAGVI
jgi:hypothetical protein